MIKTTQVRLEHKKVIKKKLDAITSPDCRTNYTAKSYELIHFRTEMYIEGMDGSKT